MKHIDDAVVLLDWERAKNFSHNIQLCEFQSIHSLYKDI